MTSMTHNHSNANPQVTGFSFLLGRPFSMARQVFLRFKERRELNRLTSYPDYLLQDIGLQRGDIQREAMKPLWRE
jgi:uncharacterized protein YjiS (DUF1127 family)